MIKIELFDVRYSLQELEMASRYEHASLPCGELCQLY